MMFMIDSSRRAVVVASAAFLTACAAPPTRPARLQAGMPEHRVLSVMGAPTGRYALDHDGARLEYATGPYGESTWMVDVDRNGRARRWAQVLTDGNLSAAQRLLPGMTRTELLRTLGRPSEVRGGGLQGGQVWSWRFNSMACRRFQVSIGTDGVVRDGVFGPDPSKCGNDDGLLLKP